MIRGYMEQPNTTRTRMIVGVANRRTNGFTLIEMMVVVAVVAILVAIAVPSYQEQVRKSRRGQAQADLVELAQRAERFHTVNNSYANFWASVPAAHRVSPRDGSSAFYNIGISGDAANTFVLTATPIAGTGQAADRCGAMTINQAGRKTHATGSDSECRFGGVATPPPDPDP